MQINGRWNYINPPFKFIKKKAFYEEKKFPHCSINGNFLHFPLRAMCRLNTFTKHTKDSYKKLFSLMKWQKTPLGFQIMRNTNMPEKKWGNSIWSVGGWENKFIKIVFLTLITYKFVIKLRENICEWSKLRNIKPLYGWKC